MTIDEWWPTVNREVRRWVAGHLFTPLSPFSLDEIEKAGGPLRMIPIGPGTESGSNGTSRRMQSRGYPLKAGRAAKVRSKIPVPPTSGHPGRARK